MTRYAAPLQDMRFVLNELAGLPAVAALPGYEEVTPDLVDAILEEAAKFAAEVLAPLNVVGDRHGSRLEGGQVVTPPGFREAYRRFVEAGWNGLDADPRFGGQGLPQLVAKPVHEMWKSANLAFSLCPMLTAAAVKAIWAHGSEAQQETFLPKLVSGEWTGTMNLTEPQAGSDLSAVRTRAIPEGGHYRLRGTKIFITWGEHDMAENIVHLVLARLPDAPEGVKGISLFIVPKFLVNRDGSLGPRNDVQAVSLEHKMGIHASPTAVMAYGENEGAVGYLVGEPHRGLEYMFTMMNHARLAVGLEGVAIAERAYQQAAAYAKERVQGRPVGRPWEERVPIIRHPDVRRMLMGMKAQVEAMRALAYFACGFLDRAERHPDPAVRREAQSLVDLLTPVVKGWCTEQSVEVASTGIQVHGGMGFIEETGACQHLRDARITPIYEGTTGIQANDLVGRKLVRDGGATATAFIRRARTDAQALERLGDAELMPVAKAVTQGLEALEEASRWLLKTYPDNPSAAAAGAVPYLKLFGLVAGGWLLAKAAGVARQRMQSPEADAAWHRAKVVTARFYADHLLPQAAGLAHTVTHGSDSVLALEETAF
ncbi:acyl-CoA dehydrogenase [Pelomicrobium methylotrophicum]|uniref:3-methylmercaptopropionyl-CoA dehydrogenase n=1 Tax=Pelomicrobium methylotrophicum TaxID=2602750 RepID=A0A5C7EIN9_9PROT|nr:acyl-CoA dehydrogenase [Pelomicrobium methylotrophicum]TXF11262.1 acyl-CoA dehydrogenase [Pelomicrobium methylotrophicum]